MKTCVISSTPDKYSSNERQYDGEPFTDVSVWDGYGQQRNDNWSGQRADAQYTPDDPVGFEGQAGYNQDWELAQTT